MIERFIAFDVETPDYMNNRRSVIGISVVICLCLQVRYMRMVKQNRR